MRWTARAAPALRGISLGVSFFLLAGAADLTAAALQSAQTNAPSEDGTSEEGASETPTQPPAVEPRLPEGAVDSEAVADPTQGPQRETFQYPVHNGYRLNFCYLPAQDQCGQPAAETWCREKGFAQVASWSRDPNVGALFPTIIMGLDQICDEYLCDGFEEITCTQ
jgi:hypothetical protein